MCYADKATNGLPSHLAQEGLALCHDMKMNLDMLRSWKHSEELLAECGSKFALSLVIGSNIVISLRGVHLR